MAETPEKHMDICKECNKDNDVHMVCCSNCKGMYHWDCAQVTQREAQGNWRCKNCSAVLKTAAGTLQDSLLQEVANKAGSVHSVSSKASSNKARRLQAELQMVDEEMAVIAEKSKLLQQREMLIRKRRALMQQQTEADDDSESMSTVDSIRASRCKDWVQCRKVASGTERVDFNAAAATTLQQSQPSGNTAEAEAVVEKDLQKSQVSENLARPSRAEITSASQWLPGIIPMSSTVNTNDVTHNCIVSQPHVSTTFSLTPEQIAARKGLAKDLPKFTGKPEEWTLFMATYEQTTQLCGFSDEENLIRLRHALDGVARNCVKCLLLNAACVPQILSTLRMKFGRPELIIDILLNQIRDMPPPKENRMESIVDFAIEVQNVCATMKAANMTNYLNNPELEQELVCKLPGLLAAFWGMHKATLVTSSLENFSEWLFQLAQGANSVMLPSSSSKTYRRGGNVNAHSQANVSKGTSAAECIVCKGSCSKVAFCNCFIKMNRADKWKAIRKYHLCKICLLPHFPQPCASTLKCTIDNCNMDHHQLLHKKASPAEQVVPSVSVNCNTHHSHSTNPIIFRILPVTIYGNGVKISTYAFIDDGSSLTLVDEDLFNGLNLQGKRQPLCMQWTSNTHRNEDDSVVSNFEISGADSKKLFLLKDVHTVKKLDLPLQTVDGEKFSRQYKHLRGIPLPSYTNVAPRILIGLNNTRVGQTLKSKEGGENEPIAEKTRLGWTVKGEVMSTRPMVDAVNYHSSSLCDCDSKAAEELLTIVRNYIVNDNYIDMPFDKSVTTSYEDQLAMQQLEKLTHRVDSYFETGLLWRCQEPLPDGSFHMAKKRAMCLQSKMENDKNLDNVLQSKIADYLSKGYARKLLPSELQVDRCWYLPIFPVTNPNKPGKTRLVWDAAAKVQGISLNTMLLKGPDQLTSLVSVIRRFRQKRIAIGGDIAEMFHQVRMRKEDQQFQRFLWHESGSSKLETYVMTVMTFGASCSPSCAQYVKNINAKDFCNLYPRATQCIIENHYVDDMLDSVDTEEEAIQLAQDVRFVHSQAGFHIRNWVSNSNKVLEALNASTVEQISFNIDGVCAAEKILGMWWDMATDSFVYKISPRYKNSDLLSGMQRPTKREVLSVIMTIFDPLGVLGFFVVFAKIVFQETWRSGCGWDETIGEDQYIKWLRWVRCLQEVERIQIPRCYIEINSKNISQVEIHTFVDASEEAYAAVSYLRCTDGYATDVSLLGCKTKVAPLKMLSIPRLELQGAVIGARLAKSLGESLSLTIHKYTFWADSSTVLSWLRSDHRRYKQFVAFRVSEIIDLTDVSNWRWVPTDENVADEATKWKRTPDFSQDSRWLNGPSFLKLHVSEWPERILKNTPESEKELRSCYVGHHRSQNCDEPSFLTIAAHRISQWKRLVRVVATVFQSIQVWKNLKNRSSLPRADITHDDICASEKLLFKEAQKEFSDEIIVLSEKRSVPKSSSLYKLSPYIDEDGLLRLGGRVKLLNDNDPIIMPRRHRITNLVVLHFHFKYHHGNNETVVNEIRQHFWIPQLRTEVYKTRRSCQICRNRAAKPTPPQMGRLPPTRVAAFCRPFSYVGVDYFGPLMVSVRRSREKRYGVLLTCLTTRAIHLEIAYSLSTDSCIMAIRNFISRRGVPLEIWSDNGTNFKGAQREIFEAFAAVDKNELIRAFTTSATKWNFIPPASPHMGGAWERLVRSVKSVLLNVIASRTPTDELLRAALMEVEMTVNSRPLTYIPIDPDLEEALTPNHFILGSSDGTKPLVKGVSDGILLRRAWQTSQQLANSFWKRWAKEYLPIITRRSKWFNRVKPIEVNDIVYIVDPANPRNCWPKGKVVAVRSGSDGQVRSATIKTSTGVYVRPATMIAVLEVRRSAGEVDPCEDIPVGSVN